VFPDGTTHAAVSPVLPHFEQPLSVPDVDRPARIVFVGHDVEICRLIADCLGREGYDVHEVVGGGEVLLRTDDSSFLRSGHASADLFLTDVPMPGDAGLELLRGLREGGVQVPIVVMTAFENVKTRKRAETLDAVLLDKPFKMGALRALVRRLLRQKSS